MGLQSIATLPVTEIERLEIKTLKDLNKTLKQYEGDFYSIQEIDFTLTPKQFTAIKTQLERPFIQSGFDIIAYTAYTQDLSKKVKDDYDVELDVFKLEENDSSIGLSMELNESILCTRVANMELVDNTIRTVDEIRIDKETLSDFCETLLAFTDTYK